MNGITDAITMGFTEVLTAAGWVSFDRWTIDGKDLHYRREDDGTPVLVSEWRPLTTFEEMIKEDSEELKDMEMARDRWPIR